MLKVGIFRSFFDLHHQPVLSIAVISRNYVSDILLCVIVSKETWPQLRRALSLFRVSVFSWRRGDVLRFIGGKSKKEKRLLASTRVHVPLSSCEVPENSWTVFEEVCLLRFTYVCQQIVNFVECKQDLRLSWLPALRWQAALWGIVPCSPVGAGLLLRGVYCFWKADILQRQHHHSWNEAARVCTRVCSFVGNPHVGNASQSGMIRKWS
jgi:hypothetical protein